MLKISNVGLTLDVWNASGTVRAAPLSEAHRPWNSRHFFRGVRAQRFGSRRFSWLKPM